MSDYKICTSSWHTKINSSQYGLIGISRGTPRGRTGFRRYPPLHPGAWWRDIDDDLEWSQVYDQRVLAKLDPNRVAADLAALAGGKTAVLICWERPPPDPLPCHRALVSRWLQRNLGIEVPELGHERHGCGCRHPKLAAAWRD